MRKPCHSKGAALLVITILTPLAASILVSLVMPASPANSDPPPRLERPGAPVSALARPLVRDRTAPEVAREGLGHEDHGPDLALWYFEKWHQHYGAVLPSDVTRGIWDEIRRMPGEPAPSGALTVNSWHLSGPSGSVIPGSSIVVSGRILDIDPDGPFYVAAASGGLWSGYGAGVSAASAGVPDQAIGAFATAPGLPSTIIVGTGEAWLRGGSGAYKSTDGGASWHAVQMSPDTPVWFFRIRYTTDNPNQVYAAAASGLYRSTDGGEHWTQARAGTCTDVMVSNSSLHLVVASFYGEGLFYSYDSGATWTVFSSLPTGATVGRTAIAASANLLNMWVSITRSDTYSTLGVYRTSNTGGTWTNASPPSDIHYGQGWYVNTIAVSPVTPSVAIVGGIILWRTTNNGATWSAIGDPDVHADQHALAWPSARTVYSGNDGGLSVSTDGGLNWDTLENHYPITQYVNFDVGIDVPGCVFGGSQDNGFTGTPYGGAWQMTAYGDGGGITIDPTDSRRIWGTLGAYGGDWAFRRHRSYDSGTTWDNSLNNGIPPSDQWFTKIRNDRVAPVHLYTNSGPEVYRSTDDGSSWSAMGGAFPCDIYNLTVSRYSAGSSVIYAALAPDSPYTGRQLRVYDNGAWYERSTGLPHDVYVRGVAIHPTDVNKAYALMTGFDGGQKVYKTTNRGVTWTNISGNLPNVPMADLVCNPGSDDSLYLGTEFGCYRTTNGGVTWETWNNGMPVGNIITEMALQDLRPMGGTCQVWAASYGRSIWSRDIAGGDRTSVAQGNALPAGVAAQEVANYPNPVRDRTTITFSLPRAGEVDISLYDVSGRRLATIWRGPVSAGRHELPFDAAKLTNGAYYYRVSAGDWVRQGTLTIAR